ncbi:MAG: N-acetylmuramoyl-L-alanine amidase [Pseudomonadales bacterium]|nr:N-acetylmuramoyl-L-alanine amidase [Pseudomonadales bacterium]
MKVSFRFSLAMLWGLLFSTAAAQAATVESIRSYRAPDHTRLVFDLSAAIEHKVFTLEKPDRIVIDLNKVQALNNLPRPDLSNTPVTGIRSAVRNQTDLRVVLDLNTAVKPRSFVLRANEQYGERLVLDLYDDPPASPASASSASDSSPGSARSNRSRLSSADLDAGKRDIVVAISAGHGGEDPGAIGVKRLMEKNVVLAIAREVNNLLASTPGYQPVMIRSGDYYVDLRRQIKIAHEHHADLFIAIHADAFSTSSARGATVYALSQRGATSEQARRLAEKENSADLIGGVGSVSLGDKDQILASVLLDLSMTASIASSLEVGNSIIAALGTVSHMRRTTVEQAAFVVLKSADIPSLLIETGYVTNPTDAKNLNSSAYQKKLAHALVDGITSHFYRLPPRGTWVYWQKQNQGLSIPYTVARGDSLSEIAARFGVTVAQIKTLNGLNGNTIRVGQVLLVAGSASPEGRTATFVEHKIARGETLSGIADNYSIPLARIRESNQLLSDTIRVGQILKIPAS